MASSGERSSIPPKVGSSPRKGARMGSAMARITPDQRVVRVEPREPGEQHPDHDDEGEDLQDVPEPLEDVGG